MSAKPALAVLLLLSLALRVPAQEAPVAAVPAADAGVEALKGHLEVLCSKEHAGRYGPAAEKTRAYIEAAFKKAGLAKIGESYRHAFKANGLEGQNIVGVLEAPELDRAPGYVLVHAHYDHLGHRGERYYPGACDNASGVAVLLELLQGIDRAAMKRDLVVVAFDLEERGLLGSFAWTERPPLPLSDCVMSVALDMLGRPALGIIEDQLIVQGWEWTPEILPLLKKVGEKNELGLSYFWTDITGDRADFVAFKRKGIPHLFFTCGENEDYHQISDTPEKLDFALLAKEAGLVRDLAQSMLAADFSLTYREEPQKNLIEFRSLKELARAIGESKHPRVSLRLRQQATFLLGFAAGVLERGEVRDEDRAHLLQVSRRMQQEMR